MFICLNVKMIERMFKQKKKYILKKQDKTSGFTLIELLVAMAIFSIVIVSIVGIFTAGINGAQRVFDRQGIQESGRFILESISKEIRMSEINTPIGGPYAILSITNAKGQTLDYFFDGASKRLVRDSQYLSPGKIETTGSFYVQRVDNQPARVTVVLKLKNILED